MARVSSFGTPAAVVRAGVPPEAGSAVGSGHPVGPSDTATSSRSPAADAGADTAQFSSTAALRVAVMRLSRRMRQERDGDVSATALSTLATLERRGPLTLGELAASEHVQPPSMTKVVAGLVEHGLATRATHPTDGRQVLAAVTDAGRARLAADRRRRDEWLAVRLDLLSPEQRAALEGAVPVLQQLADQ